MPSTVVLDCPSIHLHKTQQHNSKQPLSQRTILPYADISVNDFGAQNAADSKPLELVLTRLIYEGEFGWKRVSPKNA